MSSSTSEPLANVTNQKRKTQDGEEQQQGPASKKQEVAVAPAPAAPTPPKLPCEVFFEKKSKFMNDNPQYLGSVLVAGLAREDGTEQDEDPTKLTTEQMDSLRYVLITQNRSDKLDEMRELILGDQVDSCCLMFTTSFSYHIMDSLYTIKQMLAQEQSDKQLDILFAYTYTIKEHNYWMHDNEGGMDDFTSDLAGIWKRLLKKTNDQLGIDAEFTRPALLKVLAQFKKKVEVASAETISEDHFMTFNYA